MPSFASFLEALPKAPKKKGVALVKPPPPPRLRLSYFANNRDAIVGVLYTQFMVAPGALAIFFLGSG